MFDRMNFSLDHNGPHTLNQAHGIEVLRYIYTCCETSLRSANRCTASRGQSQIRMIESVLIDISIGSLKAIHVSED